ncbi:polysaccharide deacetylase family protein [Chitinophaga varians]|uniref:Polysaccharide deacetylase family protein n=1 Tax=Chitinophaga varians TaxID=2202339 RepID=A0A847RJJ4_9BACT|nr:polysaccharide deacetylase family protein [Chitinophaga varians]NLR63152.1 polysaccharide deacetylase family protein [Chitinophaga varians]
MRYLLFVILFLPFAGLAQRQVAITMDDAPVMALPEYYTAGQRKAVSEKLLQQINALRTPVSVFIVGDNCIAPDNQLLLKKWVDNPLITLGSHTLHHPNCADLSIDSFKMEVMINDYIIRAVAKDKPVPYFRFPYNAMGKDSMAQAERTGYLKEKGYTAVPFTIESNDYLFERYYQDALRAKDNRKAKAIGEAYIRYTLFSFDYFEKLAREIFGRDIPQVYLCHVNQLNADHYTALVKALQQRGYRCVSLQQAMQDNVYNTPLYDHSPYGFSWLFRWIPDAAIRKTHLRNSPESDKELAAFK